MTKMKIFLIILGITLLFFVSEIVNYLSDPASQSSIFLNKYFIENTISDAKNGNFEKAMTELSLPSRINIYGEYDPYRNLLPADFDKALTIPNDDSLKILFTNYLGSLTASDLKNNEDQGLGRIYYNLALIAYNNGHPELTPTLLSKAIYNNPEFPEFHAELINYYFSVGKSDDVSREMNYCLKFTKGWANILCEAYRNDSIRLNIPKPVGYLHSEVEGHYIIRQ